MRRQVLAALALAALLGTGGCSSVPDALSPVEWYRDTRDWITGEERVDPAKRAAAKPIPGAGQPFPSLHSVPERPAATPDAERRQIVERLTADRESARYVDEEIRRQTAGVTASRSSASLPQGTAPASPGTLVERFATDGPPVATIHFGVGAAEIDSRGRRAVREAFGAWRSRGGRIRVVGHASGDTGTRGADRVSHDLANFRVSDERARAVAQELIGLGVDPTMIIVEAVSDQQPAAPEAIAGSAAENRRAEILLEN